VNTIRASLRALRRVDEAPYRRAPGHYGMVMVSSAIYPALDRDTPALFSRRIVTGELRGRLDHDGVSVTDALDVPSLSGYGSPGRRGLRSARAGVDLLLFSGARTGGAAQRALARAVAAGRASRTAGERSAARVLSLRAGVRRR
jgi:beta-N-acetylhexosaminidase